MIKKFLAIFFLVAIASNSVAFAEEPTQAQISEALLQLPSVRWIPGQPFYFAITLKEKISWLIRPNPAQKAQFDLTTSGKRLKEVYLLVQKNDYKRGKETLSNYKKTLEKAASETEKAQTQGQNPVQLLNNVQNSFATQKIVLDQLYATESAKEQMGNEISDAQKSLLAAAKKLEKFRPDIFIPFQEASKSANF